MTEKMQSHELLCAKCGKLFDLEMVAVRGGNVRPQPSLYCPQCIESLGGRAAGNNTPGH